MVRLRHECERVYSFPNGHRSDKLVVIERGWKWYCLTMGMMVHILTQCVLEGIHSVAIGCSHEKWEIVVSKMKWKRATERDSNPEFFFVTVTQLSTSWTECEYRIFLFPAFPSGIIVLARKMNLVPVWFARLQTWFLCYINQAFIFPGKILPGV